VLNKKHSNRLTRTDGLGDPEALIQLGMGRSGREVEISAAALGLRPTDKAIVFSSVDFPVGPSLCPCRPPPVNGYRQHGRGVWDFLTACKAAAAEGRIMPTLLTSANAVHAA
jgi:hypothetical protein